MSKSVNKRILRLDIREIPKPNSSKIMTTNQSIRIRSILQSYGIEAKVNRKTKEISVDGVEWQAKEYLGKVKKYVKNKIRIDKKRERFYMNDKYTQPEVRDLIHKETIIKEKIKGLDNALETQRKILDRSEGPSRLDQAAMNRDALRKLTYEAMYNGEELMEKILKDAKKQDTKTKDNPKGTGKQIGLDYYFDDFGRFRSKKKEREYLQMFVELATTKYEEYEGQFFGFVDKELGYTDEEGIRVAGRGTYQNLDEEQKKGLIREYIKDRIEQVKTYKDEEAEESEEFDMSDKDLELFKKGVIKNYGK